MTSVAALHLVLDETAARAPDRVAVEEADGRRVRYGELAPLSDRVRDWLLARGVRPGDRVGLYLPKSIDAVAGIFGALKAGAAYVPVDPLSPPARAAYILRDCAVRAVLAERTLLAPLEAELAPSGGMPDVLVLDGVGGGAPLARALDAEGVPTIPGRAGTVVPPLEALAYLLYTSGSTGKPKGVMLSHRAALAFVDWCSEVFAPTEWDCFSSHAPFHFDLSILDLYVSLKHGARLVLIGEELGKEPQALAPLIAERRITVWYSTPSILSLLGQYGKLERHDLSALRLVLFAGEVFPVPALRALTRRLPHPRYFNLYGPTETNVCTYTEIPLPVPEERTEPYPIGRTCSHLASRVVDEAGRDVPAGEEGELVIAGPGIMSGYWNLPERNAQAFLADGAGRRWYRTGDLVVETGGVYHFHGRRDRMVKRRGYRIELGEIEAGLAGHPAVREVAVVAVPDEASGVLITAFLCCRDGARPTIIELKRFCLERLPRYMAPDRFRFLDALPRTATDKIDYQTLKAER
ncbi:MAG TPA: amino acid adenylation domain-containing protein [Gemmatimonadales bacterium]|nr:amino acid adenylation domain-containing protein [Gemmatimonadales bacterium]